MLLLPLGYINNAELKVGDEMTLTMFGLKLQPPHPLAVVKVDKIYTEAGLATVAAVPGRQFDAIDLRDLARKGTKEIGPLAVEPGPGKATETRVPMRAGAMTFEAVLEKNTAAHTCTLRVDRLESREQKGKRFTLWSNAFSSWPDAVELKDGRLQARNEFRTWILNPLDGTTERMIESPAAKTPAKL
jgi:hypothetical protein